MNKQQPTATWQFLLILDYADLISTEEVDFLLGNYGLQTRLDFWTENYSRANELIERLDESIQK